MRFMNDFDLQQAEQRFSRGNTPNRERVVHAVDRLREWADANSDGWAFWPKPVRAAAKAIDLIDSWTWAEREAQERHDATDAEVTAALRPIKAFLTRHNADHTEVLS